MGLEMAEELMEDVECSKGSYHATHQYPVVYTESLIGTIHVFRVGHNSRTKC